MQWLPPGDELWEKGNAALSLLPEVLPPWRGMRRSSCPRRNVPGVRREPRWGCKISADEVVGGSSVSPPLPCGCQGLEQDSGSQLGLTDTRKVIAISSMFSYCWGLGDVVPPHP